MARLLLDLRARSGPGGRSPTAPRCRPGWWGQRSGNSATPRSRPRQHFARHPIARFDGALHPTGADPVVGVLTGKEDPAVEGRRNDGKDRVSLVAYRRPDDCTRPGVVRPALDDSEEPLDRTTHDGAHRGVDAVEDLLVSEARWFDVTRRQARHDDGPTALMDRLLHDETRHPVCEATRSDGLLDLLAFRVLDHQTCRVAVAQLEQRAHLVRRQHRLESELGHE